MSSTPGSLLCIISIVFYLSGSSLVTQSLLRRKMRCFRLRRSQSDCRRRSEQFLDVCSDGRRDFRRLEALDDRAVAVDEELREVPLDARLLVVVNILLAEHPVKQGTQLVFEIEAAKGLSPSVSALQR